MELLHKGVKKSCDNCFRKKSCQDKWRLIPDKLAWGDYKQRDDSEEFGFCHSWRWVIDKEPIFIKKQEVQKEIMDLQENYLEYIATDEEKAKEIEGQIFILWNEMNRLGDELDK